jgi:5-methylcytosine-specific restriction endonuclease McrA
MPSPFSDERLSKTFDRTAGRCHLCGNPLAYSNYGIIGARRAWEIEHSRAKANGGTDHASNLYASCITCNRQKGTSSTRAFRRRHGRARAPLSDESLVMARQENALAGSVLGALVGSAAGRQGAAWGALLGAVAGYQIHPDP